MNQNVYQNPNQYRNPNQSPQETQLQTQPKQDLFSAEYKCLAGSNISLTADIIATHFKLQNATPQELVYIVQTCKAKQLNPFEYGELYVYRNHHNTLVFVIGKHAYIRRAKAAPDFNRFESGVVVLREGQIFHKNGTAVYQEVGEQLLGGWCRVFYNKNGQEQTMYREVAFSEYTTGKSTWTKIPGTMIEKVAITQCLREAFPSLLGGLYGEEEMDRVVTTPINQTTTYQQEPIIQQEPEPTHIHSGHRKHLFDRAEAVFGETANETLKNILGSMSLENTKDLTMEQFNYILDIIENSKPPQEFEQELEQEFDQPQEPQIIDIETEPVKPASALPF